MKPQRKFTTLWSLLEDLRFVRAGILLGLSVLLILFALSLRGQGLAIESEHRMTAVETKLDDLTWQVRLLMGGVAGLVGETAIRLMKRRDNGD